MAQERHMGKNHNGGKFVSTWSDQGRELKYQTLLNFKDNP